MKAPLPVFTSNKIQSLPAAIFLPMMETAINGILSTVAVTSLRAYSFLSAGVKLPDCPMTLMPILFTISKNSSLSKLTRMLGMDSSLSTVPPVCPNPRPDIFATLTPQAAARGPTIKVVLSPTPPVECLSTLIPSIDDKSTTSPLLATKSVITAVSSLVIPRK